MINNFPYYFSINRLFKIEVINSSLSIIKRQLVVLEFARHKVLHSVEIHEDQGRTLEIGWILILAVFFNIIGWNI